MIHEFKSCCLNFDQGDFLFKTPWLRLCLLVLLSTEAPAAKARCRRPRLSSLVWSHATNSRAKLDAALSDPAITAIEADIMMGCCDDDDEQNAIGDDEMAIMSHPPFSHSDLSAEQFLVSIFQDTTQQGMERHIKLDFKEMKAVEPVLTLLATHHTKDILEFRPTIYLNADILEGPGVRGPDAVTVRTGEFLSTCLKHIEGMAPAGGCSQTIRQCFAFSLGYKCNYKSRQPYIKTRCMRHGQDIRAIRSRFQVWWGSPCIECTHAGLGAGNI